jgi:Raf kinase inhibitor-like YbhB/YbcL family protein
LRLAAVVCGAAGVAACGSAVGQSHPRFLPHIKLSSPAFASGARIPARYTCDGADVSLPLHWTGVPSQATSLTLTVDDINAPGGNFIHWQMTGIPASVGGLSAGHVPSGVTQRVNGFGTSGYRGPCPPHGDPPHHYVIKLRALRGGNVIAQGTLTGTFARP